MISYVFNELAKQHECLSHSAEAVVTVEPSVLIDLSIVKIEKKGENRKTNNYLYITIFNYKLLIKQLLKYSNLF